MLIFIIATLITNILTVSLSGSFANSIDISTHLLLDGHLTVFPTETGHFRLDNLKDNSNYTLQILSMEYSYDRLL